MLYPFRPAAQAVGDDAEVAAQHRHLRRRAVGVFHAHHPAADAAVVDDHREDGQPHPRRRFQLHARHPEGSVAQQVRHQMVGAAQLGANGGAHRPAHSRHATHSDKVARPGGRPEGNHITPAAPGVMQRDGAVGVNGLIKFLNHAVAVGRGFRVHKAGRPLGGLLFVAKPDFLGDFRFDAAAVGAQPFPHGVNDGAQGQPGVGQHRQVNLVGFVQIGRVGIDMNDADAFRYRPPVGAVGLPEGIAHRQYHIRLAVDVQRRARCVAAARINAAAQGQRVVFGENALAHNGGSHRH